MTKDKFYEQAFTIKNTEPWKQLAEADLFAVELSDGNIAYVCVMGNGSIYHSVNIYPGAEELRTYWDIMLTPSDDHVGQFEAFVSSDYIGLEYLSAKFTPKPQKEETAAWAKANGVKISRGNSSYPFLCRKKPGKELWPIQETKELDYVNEVLDAVLYMTEQVKKQGYYEVGFKGQYPDIDAKYKVPCVTRKNGNFSLKSVVLPNYKPQPLPEFKLPKHFWFDLVKAKKKKGTLEMKVIHMFQPVREEKGECGFYAAMMFVVDKDGMIIFSHVEKDLYENATDLVMKVAENFSKMENCPSHIEVSDDITESLLKEFCKRTGVKLKKVYYMEELEMAHQSMMMMMRVGGV